MLTYYIRKSQIKPYFTERKVKLKTCITNTSVKINIYSQKQALELAETYGAKQQWRSIYITKYYNKNKKKGRWLRM
ncbi:hypothetical protein [Sulfurisphaera javensis]|uniref:hypothetical protein n=1 Tax=Sulfurisphaera javensis TaxID=2049879 RepID=UPI0034E89022